MLPAPRTNETAASKTARPVPERTWEGRFWIGATRPNWKGHVPPTPLACANDLEQATLRASEMSATSSFPPSGKDRDCPLHPHGQSPGDNLLPTNRISGDRFKNESSKSEARNPKQIPMLEKLKIDSEFANWICLLVRSSHGSWVAPTSKHDWARIGIMHRTMQRPLTPALSRGEREPRPLRGERPPRSSLWPIPARCSLSPRAEGQGEGPLKSMSTLPVHGPRPVTARACATGRTVIPSQAAGNR